MPSIRHLLVFGLLGLYPGVPAPSEGQVTPPPARPQEESGRASEPVDTLALVSHVRRIIQDSYSGSESLSSLRVTRGRNDMSRGPGDFVYCDGGEGEVCDGGDPDRGPCPSGASCHSTEEFLLRELTEAAEEYPSSRFILGQAVYHLTKFRQTTLALALAEQCQAEPWWCDTLMGYVLHAQGRSGEAEAFFRRSMASSPIPERCAWGDALWLLGEWSQERGGIAHLPPGREETADWPCLDRLEISDTLFWLADPLYSVEGNERWVEHMARAVGTHLYAEVRDVARRQPVPPEYKELDWAMRIRRGVWDSYRSEGSQGRVFWTSQEKAPYHFIPHVTPGDFSSPVWELQGDLFHEGFRPAFSPFFAIPAQVARFRARDSLRVLAAGALAGTPLEDAPGISAQFILTDSPGSFPLFLTGNTFRTNAVFLGQAPAQDYVVGLEVLSGEGVGWYREFVRSLAPSGPELSDLLLYGPRAEVEPDSLLEAAGLMLSSLTISGEGSLGVFWEVYGADPGQEMTFELALQEEAQGGVVGRLTRIIPGAGQAAYGPVRWTEEASGTTHATNLRLELENLEPGDYQLVLNVEWEGQEKMQRSRRVKVS